VEWQANNPPCTAFHRLHETEAGLADCLLFGHTELLAVRGLGGICHRFADKPPSKGQPAEDDEDDQEVALKRPVYMAPLGGPGRCRGPGWTFKRWPIVKGPLAGQACAEACARRKGCTAFDLSGGEGLAEAECALYGHQRVAPASGVPGRCYVLSASSSAAAKVYFWP
jgi:hypothetical protein